jgi:phytoene dehydrogenase-like protein
MSTNRYDAIIIGAGHNGLTTAAYLSKAGQRVLVLEKRPIIGGATLTEQPNPGFKYSVFSYLVSLLRPEVIHDLELTRHGLMILPTQSTLNPLPGGDYLYREADPHRTRRHIARHSARDAEAYGEYKIMMRHVAHAMQAILRQPMPAPDAPQELAGWVSHILDLPREVKYTLLQMVTLSAADFLDHWFESEPLKAALSTSSIIGSFVGPRSPGSAYVLLHHYMGEVDGAYRAWGFQKGGTGGVAAAIASAARHFGAEIRTEADVDSVIVKNGRAVGVALQNGDELYATAVTSSLTPQHNFLRLLDSATLPADLVAQARQWQSQGCSGKVNLSLSDLPRFACMPQPGPHLAGGFSIAPSIDYIEEAYDEAKYGRFSTKPFLDMLIPSAIDPDMAPPGQHVMSCFVQYAPYELDGGWTEAKREAFGDRVIDVLAEYIPNIREIIIHRQVLTPVEIESIVGITGGNIFHGELNLAQLFLLRPAAGYSQYETAVPGFYQCGSSTHPGGGIMGAPGRLAAQAILANREQFLR